MNTYDASQAIRRVGGILDVCQKLWDELPAYPEDLGKANSEISRLVAEVPPGRLNDPRGILLSSLLSGLEALKEIHRFCTQVSVTAIVHKALMRIAVLSGLRSTYMLGPETFAERRANTLRAMMANSKSRDRYFKDAKGFVHLVSMSPPDELQTEHREAHQSLSRAVSDLEEQRPLGEGQMLQDATMIVGRLLQERGFEGPLGIPQEQISYIFSAYSGLAHGYEWPRILPQNGGFPGSFDADLVMVASLTHLSFDLVLKCHKTDD